MKIKITIISAILIVVTIIVSYVLACPPPADTCHADGFDRSWVYCRCDEACVLIQDYQYTEIVTYCAGDCVNWWKYCTEGSFENVTHWYRQHCRSYVVEGGKCKIELDEEEPYEVEPGHTTLTCYCKTWI